MALFERRDPKAQRRKADTIVGLVLLASAALLWFWLIPDFVQGGSGDQLFIRALAIVIAGMAGLLLGSSLMPSPSAVPTDDAQLLIERDDRGEPPRFILLIAVWGLDVFLMQWLGFYPLSFLALVSSMLLFGMRRWGSILFWSIVPLVIMYFIFEYGFSLTLPRGTLLPLG